MDTKLVKTKILSNGYQLAIESWVDPDGMIIYALAVIDTTDEDSQVDVLACTDDISTNAKKSIEKTFEKNLKMYSRKRSIKPGSRKKTFQSIIKDAALGEEAALVENILADIENDVDVD